MTAIPVFEQQLTTADLSITSVSIPEQPLMQKELYLDINAPFTENFRKSDSTWSLATESELQAGLAWWKKQVESGQAAKILEDAEKVRAVIGQSTSITSMKKKAVQAETSPGKADAKPQDM